MPLGFVARSYGVEREALAAALDVSSGANRRISLEDLAKSRDKRFEVLATISDALSTLIGLATSLTLMAITMNLLRRRGARGQKSVAFGEGS